MSKTSREIKFRAWDNQKKKMYYDVQNATDMKPIDDEFGSFERILNMSMEDDYGYIDSAKRFEVMQYTGLKDKSGKEIWENDIVEISRENSLFKIEWEEDTARWVMNNEAEGFIVDFDNYWSYEVEVVGNVFDNPELLNQ